MADEREAQEAASKSTFDFATIIGLVIAFVLVITAIILGGSPASFVNIPSVFIVVGGTLAVTTVCFSLTEMLRTGVVISKTLFHSIRDPGEASVHVLTLAQKSRRHGILSLQEDLERLVPQPFLHKGVQLVVDGTPGEEVESIMRRDMLSTAQRHMKSASVLRKAAEFAPAMGLIGTLIGLVQMLGNLDDPTTIGPSMAVALLTTFYGAVLANMLFIPLASKLERNSTQEELVNQIYLMGASSIGRQENPRRLEMMLNSVMPPSQRIQFFD